MTYQTRLVTVLSLTLCSAIVSGVDCKNGTSFMCHGSRMIRNFIENISRTVSPMVIVPGLEIVSTISANETENIIDLEYDTIIGRMGNYLQHHEINIKLSELLDATKILRYIRGEVEQDQLVAESRKKDSKTYMVAISLMFGKLLTVLGIGGIGALAMKALGVASMALLMSALMGLKNIQQSNEETSHHVQYVTEDHHRRRRQVHPPQSSPLAYSGWKALPTP